MTIQQTYKAKLSDLSGTIILEGDEKILIAYYRQDTCLGQRLFSDIGSARAILANYIRQELGLPRGETNMTKIEWVNALM
jgi:hypothetical protein